MMWLDTVLFAAVVYQIAKENLVSVGLFLATRATFLSMLQ